MFLKNSPIMSKHYVAPQKRPNYVATEYTWG